jgi:hypothetical protein
MLRANMVLIVGLLLLACSACASTFTPGSADALPAPSTSVAPSTGTLEAMSGCRSADLELGFTDRVVPPTGANPLTLILTNVSAKSCYLDGYPLVVELDDAGLELPFTFKCTGDPAGGSVMASFPSFPEVPEDCGNLHRSSYPLRQLEPLVRWQHPQYGLVPPDEFIPLAEETGLIKPLTRWVIGAARQQFRAWHLAGLNLRVAVNLSGHDIQDPTLPDTIARQLADACSRQKSDCRTDGDRRDGRSRGRAEDVGPAGRDGR